MFSYEIFAKIKESLNLQLDFMLVIFRLLFLNFLAPVLVVRI